MLPAATSSDVYQPRRLARERRLETAEGHIGVTQWGPADAAPIVMLHGWMDCARGWQLLADCLPEDWPLAAIDWRGYGQSEPRADRYWLPDYLAELECVLQQLWPAGHAGRIIGHSLGGTVGSAYAGIRTQQLRWLVNMEGFGLPRLDPKLIPEHLGQWLDQLRAPPGQRRYASIEDAWKRMQEENRHLSPEQARHLTEHGVNQNEDGTYSWKFDNYVRAWRPYDMTAAETQELWSRITCPTLLIHGTESWATDPREDGRARFFKNARIEGFERAGHWVHHDRLNDFLALARDFLGPPGTA